MKGQPVLGVVIIPDEYPPLHCLYPPLAHLLTPLMPRAKATPSICTNPHPLPYQCQSLNLSSLPRGPWGYTLSLYTLKPTTPSLINVHVSDRLLWPPICMRCSRPRSDVGLMLKALETIFFLLHVFFSNFIIIKPIYNETYYSFTDQCTCVGLASLAIDMYAVWQTMLQFLVNAVELQEILLFVHVFFLILS